MKASHKLADAAVVLVGSLSPHGSRHVGPPEHERRGRGSVAMDHLTRDAGPPRERYRDASSPGSDPADLARSVTRVPGESTTRPPHCSPINATSRPMPTAIACFNDAGITTISRSRRPTVAVRMKMRPALATAPSAICHGTVLATHTVKAN